MKTVNKVSVLGVRMIQKATNSKSGGESNFTYKAYTLMSNGYFSVGDINCAYTNVRMRDVDYGDTCFEALFQRKNGKTKWRKVSAETASSFIDNVLETNDRAAEIHAEFEANRPLIVLTPAELVK
jgi:hypothetical protein